jgi:mono/diheme cytochrome c family protein
MGLLVLLLAACSGLAGEPKIIATLPPQPTVAPPAQMPDVALGASLYAQHCTQCHGASGAGDGAMALNGQLKQAPPSFRDSQTAGSQTPADWFTIITNGRIENLMPPWKDKLNDAERWAVAYFTYTLSYQAAQLQSGRDLWNAHCADCHGSAGKGDGPKATAGNLNLVDLSRNISLSDNAIFAAVSQGIPDKMPAFANALDETQRRAVVAYARSLAVTNPTAIAQAAPPETTAQPATTPPPEATSEVTLEAAARGTVTGHLTNGTAGGDSTKGLKVTLFASDGQNVQQLEATTDDKGGYSIQNVPMIPNGDYVAVTTYRERVFNSAFVKGEAGKTAFDLPITVYELTEDPAVITMTGTVIQINATGESLEVRQVLRFKNTSDRAFTSSQDLGSGRFGSLVVPLPPGAQVVGFDNEQRYVVSQDKYTVVDTAPVLPGEDHLVVVVYLLAYDGKGAVIEQGINYAFDGQARLLLWPPTLTASGSQFPALGTENLSNRTYNSYGGALKLAAGGALRYELKGAAAPGAASINPTQTGTVSSDNLLATLMLITGVGALVLAGVLFFRGRSARKANEQKLADALVGQIADLDDLHSAGKLDDETWARQRDALKTRLTELLGEGNRTED